MNEVTIEIKKESETYARHPLPPVLINTNDPNTGFLPSVSSLSGIIGFKSGDGLGQSKTFHFFSLINSLVVLAVCLGRCLAA